MAEDASYGQLERIEGALRDADPGFVARAHRAAQFDKVPKVVLAVLLQLATVLMTIGLATSLMPLWLLGVAALLLAPLFAEIHHRVECRHRGNRHLPDG